MSREIVITYTVKDNASKNLKNIGTAMNQVGDSAKKQKGIFKDLTTEAKGFIAAIGVRGVINFAEDFNALGVSVNRARGVFANLTDEWGGSAAVMERLRGVTMGVVDDFALMQGANRLMLSGVAASSTELEKMTELAVKLGGAFGKDAGSAIEEFGLMLMNQSILRLDTFGISGSNVRERMKELRQELHLTKEEAFKMAVFEEGAISMERLGTASEATGTALGRLQAKLGTGMEQAASQFATSIEGIIGILDMAQQHGLLTTLQAGGLPGTEFQLQQMRGQMGMGGPIEGSTLGLDRWIKDQMEIFGVQTQEELLAALEREQQILQSQAAPQLFTGSEIKTTDAEKARRQGVTEARLAARGGGPALKTTPRPREFLDLADYGASVGEDMKYNADEFASSIRSLQLESQKLGFSYEETKTKTRDFVTTLVSGVGQMDESLFDFRSGIAQMSADDSLGKMHTAMMEIDTIMARGATTWEGVSFFNPEELADLESRSDAMVNDYERLQGLADEGLIPQSQADIARQMADDATRLADEAQAAKTAFDNMSLSQLFGQEGGGRLGELSDVIAGSIGDEETRKRFERESDLASGRETDVSLKVKEDIAPAIGAMAEQFGADAAVAAQEVLLQKIEEGVSKGWSQERIIEEVNRALGGISLGAEGQVQFDIAGMIQRSPLGEISNMLQSPEALFGSLLGLPAGEGLPGAVGENPLTDREALGEGAEGIEGMLEPATELQTAMTASGESTSIMLENLQAMPDTFAPIQEKMDGLKSGLMDLSGGVEIPVEIKLNMATAKSALEQYIISVIQANGGVAPGTDSRARPGGGGRAM